MKDIAPILRSLGLLESETKTYLAALEHGPQTVIDLAKGTRLSRQATYLAIEALTERSLMSSVLRGKKRFYAAEHPDKLLAYAKRSRMDMDQRIQDLERTLPELELQMGGERPIVKVFEGKEGIRAVMDELSQKNAKVMRIDELSDLNAVYASLTPQDLVPFRDRLKKHKPEAHLLVAGEPNSPTPYERFILPKEFWGFKSDIVVYDNYVHLVTFEGKMHSILIESPSLVRAFRVLFELASRHGRKEKFGRR